MTTINLYQNQEETQRKNSARTANGGFIFSLGILVLTLLALAGVKFYVSMTGKQNVALAETIVQENNSLAGVNSLQHILDMQMRLAQIKNNLKIADDKVGQLKMTEALDHLGADLNSGVVASNFLYDSGKITVSFDANDFSGIANQISNFKKSSYFAEAALVDVVRGEKGISADMTMSIKSK